MDFKAAMLEYWKGKKVRDVQWIKGYYISRGGDNLFNGISNYTREQLDFSEEWEIYEETPSQKEAALKKAAEALNAIFSEALEKLDALKIR